MHLHRESTGSAAKGSRGIDPKERQQLLAELEEKKRRILRDVEVSHRYIVHVHRSNEILLAHKQHKLILSTCV